MILGIGLSKTGTTSLNKALEILGYKSLHLPSKQQLFSDNYDAFTDIPCLAYLSQLLSIYPDAKIINTTREVNNWLDSCQRHFHPTNNAYFLELREIVYHTTNPIQDDFLKAYDRHQKLSQVLKNTLLGNYLELPLESPNKWQLLTSFLNKPLPKVNYPNL